MSYLTDLPGPGYPASSATWPSSVTYVALICPRCGANHRLEQCPQVKAIEYHEDGRTIRRVEFFDGTGARPLEMTISVGPTLSEGAVVVHQAWRIGRNC
jgi:hypothetical protein